MLTANFTMIFFIYVQTGIGFLGNTPNAAQLDYFSMEACDKAGKQMRTDFAGQSVKFAFSCVERYTK